MRRSTLFFARWEFHSSLETSLHETLKQHNAALGIKFWLIFVCSGTKHCERREWPRALICAACASKYAVLFGISVISRPPEIIKGGCQVVFFSCGTWDKYICEHDQVRSANLFVHNHMAVVQHYIFLVHHVNWPLRSIYMRY